MALSRGQAVGFVGATVFGCLALVLLNLADYSQHKLVGLMKTKD